MKTFIVSICMFCILLALIVWNVIFVNSTMSELERQIASLPSCEEAGDALTRAEALWQDNRTALTLSVSYGEIRDMDVSLAEMRAAVSQGDVLQFETARLTALGAIDDIRRLERISPSSIA